MDLRNIVSKLINFKRFFIYSFIFLIVLGIAFSYGFVDRVVKEPVQASVPTWGALGAGVGGAGVAVNATEVWQNKLYVTGSFANAGGASANKIASWDGANWASLPLGGGAGNGLNNNGYALAVYGDKLIVGGVFTTAGGVAANRLAQWDGAVWTPLEVTGMSSTVYSLAVYDGKLIAGGIFTTAGGVAANRIAQWDGGVWTAMGTGFASDVNAMVVYGSDLIVGGGFVNGGGVAECDYICKWDGTVWSGIGTGVGNAVNSLTVYDGKLIAGGMFTTAGGNPAVRIAQWDGAWSALEAIGMNQAPLGLGVYKTDLIATGAFTDGGGVADCDRICKWNGAAWSEMSTGLDATGRVIDFYDYNLIVGGNFTTAGGIGAARVAKWFQSTTPTIDLVVFTNPYGGGGNKVLADNTTEWNFEVKVTDVDGPTQLDYVELRFANASDSVTPYDSLKLKWLEVTRLFQKTADTQTAATLTSGLGDSSFIGNQWTINYKLKINSNFLNKNTQYAVEVYVIDDTGDAITTNFANMYLVIPHATKLLVAAQGQTVVGGALTPTDPVTIAGSSTNQTTAVESGNFYIYAVDGTNNLATTSVAAVTLTSTDPSISFNPAIVNLVAGIGSFKVTFNTIGNQTVTSSSAGLTDGVSVQVLVVIVPPIIPPIISPVVPPVTPPGDEEPPSIPLYLRATEITENSISLAWNRATDNVKVEGYDLYNADTGIKIATTENTVYKLINLTSATDYRFYVIAFDAAGNRSGKSNILKVTTLTGAEEGQATFLSLENVPSPVMVGQKFDQNIIVKAVDAGGVVVKNYTGDIYFHSTDSKAQFTWNNANPYRFTSENAGIHEFSGKDFQMSTVGTQQLIVTDGALRASAVIEVQKKRLIDTIINAFLLLEEKTLKMFNENGGQTNFTIIAIMAGLLLVSLFVNIFTSLDTISMIIYNWILQILTLFGIRKRRKPWGTVFNSHTGKPIALAAVRIVDKNNNRVLQSTFTDNNGRFSFLADEGSYYLKVEKNGYIFPSKESTAKDFYQDIYTGGEINVKEKNEAIITNIPLDPITKSSAKYIWLLLFLRLNRFLYFLRLPFTIFGIILAIAMIVVSYDIIYVLSLIFYILVILYELLKAQRPRSFGIVSDSFGKSLDLVIVRIFEQKTNYLAGTAVTDKNGRYQHLVKDGEYYLIAVKPDYMEYKSEPMQLSRDKTQIAIDIKMHSEKT